MKHKRKCRKLAMVRSIACVYALLLVQYAPYAAAQVEAEPSYRDQMDAIQDKERKGPGGACTLGFLSGVECTSNVCRGGFCCEEAVAAGCRKCNNEGKCAECAVGFGLADGSCSLVNTQFIGDPQDSPTASPVSSGQTLAPTTSVITATNAPSVSPTEKEDEVTQAPTDVSTSQPSPSPTAADQPSNQTSAVPTTSGQTTAPSSSVPEETSASPSQRPSPGPTVRNETTEPPNSPNTLPNEEVQPLPIPTVAVLTVALFAVAGIAVGVAFWRAPRTKPKQADGT